jgi:hypothetical protein
VKQATRRQFLRETLALATINLLSGCAMPPLPGQPAARVPRIDFLAVGSREGRQFMIDGRERADRSVNSRPGSAP